MAEKKKRGVLGYGYAQGRIVMVLMKGRERYRRKRQALGEVEVAVFSERSVRDRVFVRYAIIPLPVLMTL